MNGERSRDAERSALSPGAASEIADLRRQVAELTTQRDELRACFDRLDPQKQAEAIDHVSVLGLVMYLHGIVDVEVTAEQIARVPKGYAVVFGEQPARKDVLRVRWMRQDEAIKQRPVTS